MRFSRLLQTLSLLVFLLIPGLSRAEVREWTRAADGRKITAEFVGMKDENTIQIKMANGTFEVPLDSLSEADREYVKAQKETKAAMKEGDGSTEEADATIPEGEVTVTLSGVHLCCGKCVDTVEALNGSKQMRFYPETEFKADKKDKTITIDAPSGKAAIFALEVLFKAGFCGESDHPVLTVPALKERDFKVSTMSLRDLHLCCDTCVNDLVDAVKTVEGVQEVTAEKGQTSVMIKGENIVASDVEKAARNAGFGTSFR